MLPSFMQRSEHDKELIKQYLADHPQLNKDTRFFIEPAVRVNVDEVMYYHIRNLQFDSNGNFDGNRMSTGHTIYKFDEEIKIVNLLQIKDS